MASLMEKDVLIEMASGFAAEASHASIACKEKEAEFLKLINEYAIELDRYYKTSFEDLDFDKEVALLKSIDQKRVTLFSPEKQRA